MRRSAGWGRRRRIRWILFCAFSLTRCLLDLCFGLPARCRVAPRRAPYFLCFAKESRQRKATRLWRSALQADSAVVLGVRARRVTRYANCVRSARTDAPSQFLMRALARGPAPCAPRRHPRDPSRRLAALCRGERCGRTSRRATARCARPPPNPENSPLMLPHSRPSSRRCLAGASG